MKLFSAAFFVFGMLYTHTLRAQCRLIETLDFPYEKGLRMDFLGKAVEYDALNFPTKTKDYSVHYAVKEKKGNTALFEINSVVDGDTSTSRMLSDVTVDSKGMTWTGDEKRRELTRAIRLPLEQGKKWRSRYLDLPKMWLTCFTTDSTMSLYLGEVHTFGVLYLMPAGRDGRFDYYQEYREWYNRYLGKVAYHYKTYGIERATGKEFVFYFEEVVLSHTSASEDKVRQALQACR